MKKERGFTLIELLGVIIVIALISVLVIPSLVSLLNKSKDNLSATEMRIISNAADQYISKRQSQYEKVNNATYCITLQQLIDGEVLDSPILDIETGSTVNTNRYLKVVVDKSDYVYTLLADGESCR